MILSKITAEIKQSLLVSLRELLKQVWLFVKVKRRFGKPLIDATVYQHQFADLYTKLCAAESYFASYKDRMKGFSLYLR